MENKIKVLIDTGPLIAFLEAAEAQHTWVQEQFKQLPYPFLTCEPVLTEAFFLLSWRRDGHQKIFELLAAGLLRVDFSIWQEQQEILQLMEKYKDLPMSLADACLVRMAERIPGSVVFTLDSHFRVYRKNGRQLIPLITP